VQINKPIIENELTALCPSLHPLGNIPKVPEADAPNCNKIQPFRHLRLLT
jgi:hypothetical protein